MSNLEDSTEVPQEGETVEKVVSPGSTLVEKEKLIEVSDKETVVKKTVSS